MESVPEFRKTTGRRSLSDGYRDTWTATSSLARGLAPRRRTRVVPAGVTDRRRVRCLFQRQQSIRMLQHAMARGLRNRVGFAIAWAETQLMSGEYCPRNTHRNAPHQELARGWTPRQLMLSRQPQGFSGAFLATMRLDALAFQRPTAQLQDSMGCRSQHGHSRNGWVRHGTEHLRVAEIRSAAFLPVHGASPPKSGTAAARLPIRASISAASSADGSAVETHSVCMPALRPNAISEIESPIMIDLPKSISGKMRFASRAIPTSGLRHPLTSFSAESGQ